METDGGDTDGIDQDDDANNNNSNDSNGSYDSFNNPFFAVENADGADGNGVLDEDLISEAEEMDELDGDVAAAARRFIVALSGSRPASDAEESAGDDPSAAGSDPGDDGDDSAYVFAKVAQRPILSQQASLLALDSMSTKSSAGPSSLRSVMADLSLLGQIHRKDVPTFSLIRLPKSFVELYGVVNKVKGREESTSLDENDDASNAETAICLLTGAVMRSGSVRRPPYTSKRPPGACTLHARKNGSGIGIFFLVQKCTVLLMHNNKSAYSPSLYVDEHGEEDPSLRRGRPLFLNAERYRALEVLWRQQGIPREVAQIRSTSDRVIRDNWY